MSTLKPQSAESRCPAEQDLRNERDALAAALQRTLPTAQLQNYPLADCTAPLRPQLLNHSGSDMGTGPLTLALINSDFQTGPLPPEVMRDVVANPAYWAFCWGSGQALARYLLANPLIVAGKRVLDLGSGSGVAGIAAALAGAAEVQACDIDPDAQLATRYNAALNNVHIALVQDFISQPRYDLVLLADVLYDRSNLPLLAQARLAATEVWVADSRIKALADPAWVLQAELEALTVPNLGEFDEFGHTRIWCATT